jgi:Glycosyltransferase family 87
MGLPLFAIGLFSIAVLLIEVIDWGAGVYKALLMLGVLLTLVALTRGTRGPPPATKPLPERRLAIAVGVLLAAQVAFALWQVWDPHLIDIPASTLEAGRALLSGTNPYTSPMDHTVDLSMDVATFQGFKYSPLTAAAYMPLGIPLGDRGVVLTNLALQLAVAWLVYRLARGQGARATGLIAALGYLALPIGPWELFHQGVPDLAATLPLLAALLYVDRNAGLAGLCVGISLSAKLLPAGLLLPCCLPTDMHNRVRYAVGVAAGTVPLLLTALWSPAALWNNLVLFNLSRPPDSTSWLYWAPSYVSSIARGVLVMVFLCIGVVVWRARAITVTRRCGLGAIAILATLLTGPIAHNNYQLWWLPLASVVLAVSLDPRAPDPALPKVQCTTR